MVTAPPPFGAGANSALTYYFTIDGPDNGPIAVGIATNLLTFASKDDTSFASITTSQGTNVCADTNEFSCGGSQFDGILIEMDEPGQVYSIHLEAVASVGVFGGSAFASADPYIFVEPADIDAADYSVQSQRWDRQRRVAAGGCARGFDLGYGAFGFCGLGGHSALVRES